MKPEIRCVRPAVSQAEVFFFCHGALRLADQRGQHRPVLAHCDFQFVRRKRGRCGNHQVRKPQFLDQVVPDHETAHVGVSLAGGQVLDCRVTAAYLDQPQPGVVALQQALDGVALFHHYPLAPEIFHAEDSFAVIALEYDERRRHVRREKDGYLFAVCSALPSRRDCDAAGPGHGLDGLSDALSAYKITIQPVDGTDRRDVIHKQSLRKTIADKMKRRVIPYPHVDTRPGRQPVPLFAAQLHPVPDPRGQVGQLRVCRSTQVPVGLHDDRA